MKRANDKRAGSCGNQSKFPRGGGGGGDATHGRGSPVFEIDTKDVGEGSRAFFLCSEYRINVPPALPRGTSIKTAGASAVGSEQSSTQQGEYTATRGRGSRCFFFF